MRSRIIGVAVSAIAVALLLFALPLAVLVHSALFGQQRLELERVALRAGANVGGEFVTGDPVELPVDPIHTVGVYDTALQLRAGNGPATGDDAVRRATAGAVADLQTDGLIIVAVPITASESVVGVVRAAVPTALVWLQVLKAWLILSGLAAVALVAAVLVARRQARLLSQPLELLSAFSEQVAAGDFTARAASSPIPEIDRVSSTQNLMVDQLTQLLTRERAFSADASHQLRTPLMGFQLVLERAYEQAAQPGVDLRPALAEALEQADTLRRTVDDLLQLARVAPQDWQALDPIHLDRALDQIERQWHGPLARQGRRLTVFLDPETATAELPGKALSQILQVLLDNALRHGTGTVTVTSRAIGDAIAIDVADEGSVQRDLGTLFTRHDPDTSGHGLGLPLARSIAEACGGRLRLTSSHPTRFSVLLADPITGLQSGANQGRI